LTPREEFFREVERLLNKKSGVFCIIGYTRPYLADKVLNDLFTTYYNDVLGSLKDPGEKGCYWDIRRLSVDSKYTDYHFPFAVERKDWTERRDIPVEAFIGLIRSYSSYQTMSQTFEDAWTRDPSEDPLIQLQHSMEKIVPNGKTMSMDVPFFTILHSKKEG
jgi:hypothetical protein